MEGYEGFDGLDVEHGLVDVAEEGLLANVLDPTSSLLKIVPGNQPKVFLKVIFLNVPERVRFWLEKVHLSANGSSAFLP